MLIKKIITIDQDSLVEAVSLEALVFFSATTY